MSDKKPIMHMIIPGRRTLGEDWSEVTVAVDEAKDEIVAERKDTEAPADGKPIFVPGLGNVSIDMTAFILEQQRHLAVERAGKPKPSPAEINAEVNRMWLDYMEQKLRWLKGQSTFGPGGFAQRERSPDRHG